MKKLTFLISLMLMVMDVFGQKDTVDVEKLRTESGIDPTRINTRIGYSVLLYDQEDYAAQINNRLGINLGVNNWNFKLTPEIVTRNTGEAGTGFETGFGDMKFSILNAFYVNGKTALAGSAEISIPTGKPGFGSQYVALTPALTFSYTLKPSLFLAIQPQYTFALMKDSLYPDLSVLTIRSFLAKFTQTGYFFVFEPRPIIDFENEKVDLIVSPILGKSLGGGYNLIFLSEIPTKTETIKSRGILYQFGFNKNF